MPALLARDLSLSYEQRTIVEGLQLAIEPGEITAIVGANGSGKSTILKAMARLLAPSAGAVYLDGEAIHHTPTRAVARRLAFLPQRADSPDGLTVRELVANGRFPYRAAFGGLTLRDHDVIDRALAMVGLEDYAERPANELSGGERQCAWIAMALAQETDVLLLDEPTTFLDVRHQIAVLDLVRRLHRQAGKTVVMVLHDLNLAARYASRMVAIRAGRIVASGVPDEVMRPDILRDVFGIEAVVLRDPRQGTPMCVAYGDSEAPDERR